MTQKKKGACPLCGAPAVPNHEPFCSQGCRDRDLLNWLGESYRVPGRTAGIEDDEAESNRLDSDR